MPRYVTSFSLALFSSYFLILVDLCSCLFPVLQSVMECYPPSEKRLKLESLVARVVSPYLGHRGLYEGGYAKPVIPSRELDVAHLRRPSGK
jgi:hypothetical protein